MFVRFKGNSPKGLFKVYLKVDDNRFTHQPDIYYLIDRPDVYRRSSSGPAAAMLATDRLLYADAQIENPIKFKGGHDKIWMEAEELEEVSMSNKASKEFLIK